MLDCSQILQKINLGTKIISASVSYPASGSSSLPARGLDRFGPFQAPV